MQDGLLKVLAAVEPMAFQHVFAPAIEPLDHAVCLGPHCWLLAMLEAEVSAKLIELILSRGRADLSPKYPPALAEFLGLDCLLYVASLSMLIFSANSMGVRLSKA